MIVLRQVGSVTLNKGTLASEGLFNLFNIETEEVSLWFDEDEKNAMLNLSDEQFLHESRVKFEIAEMNN
jgi:hypothetical protein